VAEVGETCVTSYEEGASAVVDPLPPPTTGSLIGSDSLPPDDSVLLSSILSLSSSSLSESSLSRSSPSPELSTS